MSVHLKSISPNKWAVIRNGKVVFVGAFKYAGPLLDRLQGSRVTLSKPAKH